MSKEEINDLKQFITTTVRDELVAPIDGLHQEIAGVKTDLHLEIADFGASLHKEIVGFNLDLHKEIGAVSTSLGNEIISLTTEVRNNTVQIANVIERLDENDLKQDEILNAIGEINEKQFKAIFIQADRIDNHERRITKLEKRTA